MFTLQQIQSAHSRVKSGADFPRYVADLRDLGLRDYDFCVADGHAEYRGTDGSVLESPAKYAPKRIAETADTAKLQRDIAEHQQGGSDFLTMCQYAADAGVARWRTDIANLECVYFDAAGAVLLREEIPAVAS